MLDERGVSSFALIQPRIMNQDANSVSHMARKTPVHLFLFDLLWLNGEDWRGRPLAERKQKLAEIVKPHPLIKVSGTFRGKRRRDPGSGAAVRTGGRGREAGR